MRFLENKVLWITFGPKVEEIIVQRKYYIMHSLLFVLFTKYWPASVITRELDRIDTSK